MSCSSPRPTTRPSPTCPTTSRPRRRALLPRLARAIQAATGADGLNLIVNNGRVAGQTVFHGHWHLIPRFIDDPVDWPWPHAEYSGDELGQMQFRIERELNSKPGTHHHPS